MPHPPVPYVLGLHMPNYASSFGHAGGKRKRPTGVQSASGAVPVHHSTCTTNQDVSPVNRHADFMDQPFSFLSVLFVAESERVFLWESVVQSLWESSKIHAAATDPAAEQWCPFCCRTPTITGCRWRHLPNGYSCPWAPVSASGCTAGSLGGPLAVAVRHHWQIHVPAGSDNVDGEESSA